MSQQCYNKCCIFLIQNLLYHCYYIFIAYRGEKCHSNVTTNVVSFSYNICCIIVVTFLLPIGEKNVTTMLQQMLYLSHTTFVVSLL